MKNKRSVRLRILVVEDNLINQFVVSRLLKNFGQCADLAGNGREALEAFRARGYDLVFMDCQMPVMDGYTASNRIRLLERKRARRPAPGKGYRPTVRRIGPGHSQSVAGAFRRRR